MSIIPEVKAVRQLKQYYKMMEDASEFRASMQGIGDAFAGGPVDAAASKKGLQDLGVKSFKGTDGKTHDLNWIIKG